LFLLLIQTGWTMAAIFPLCLRSPPMISCSLARRRHAGQMLFFESVEIAIRRDVKLGSPIAETIHLHPFAAGSNPGLLFTQHNGFVWIAEALTGAVVNNLKLSRRNVGFGLSLILEEPGSGLEVRGKPSIVFIAVEHKSEHPIFDKSPFSHRFLSRL